MKTLANEGRWVMGNDVETELTAMRDASAIMERLETPDARLRVVCFIVDRYVADGPTREARKKVIKTQIEQAKDATTKGGQP